MQITALCMGVMSPWKYRTHLSSKNQEISFKDNMSTINIRYGAKCVEVIYFLIAVKNKYNIDCGWLQYTHDIGYFQTLLFASGHMQGVCITRKIT